VTVAVTVRLTVTARNLTRKAAGHSDSDSDRTQSEREQLELPGPVIRSASPAGPPGPRAGWPGPGPWHRRVRDPNPGHCN
jgi:hypothetical protein